MNTDLRCAPCAPNLSALGKGAMIGLALVCLIWLGAGIFFGAAAVLLAIFVAGGVSGFMASRACGLRRRDDGVTHGILSWLLVSISAAILTLPTISFGAGDMTTVLQRAASLVEVLRQPQREIDDRAQLAQLLRSYDIRISTHQFNELVHAAINQPAAVSNYLQQRLGAETALSDRVASHIATLFRDAQTLAAEERAAAAAWYQTVLTSAFASVVVLASLLVAIWAGVAGVRRASV